MRSKEQRRKCRDGHKGRFEKINAELYRCEKCGAKIGKEFVKIKGGLS